MKLNFKRGNGLIPAIIQDERTNKVLMLGFMSKESFQKTVETGKVTFFSRKRQTLWIKGETSGNFLLVKSIKEDCDHDTILIKAQPTGPVCHTGKDTCFDETNICNTDFLFELEQLINSRKREMPARSYTTRLFQKGIRKIAQKVGEESTELVIEAIDNQDDKLLEEAADLMYHFMVLLTAKGKTLQDVIAVLANRHKR
jgi:phosphoribosyl-ATP pyrophosphohydrolase/phosphoribosyl-AMP cyclohydrolase